MSDRLGFMADLPPGYDIPGLLPLTKRRSVMAEGPEYVVTPPAWARGLAQAFTASKRALYGEFDPNSPEGVEEALNMGLGALGVGTAFQAGRAAPKGQLATITHAERAPWATPIKPAGGKAGQNYVFMSDADFRIKRGVQDHLLEHGAWAGKLGDVVEGQTMRAHPEIWQYPVTVRLRADKAAEGNFNPRTKEIFMEAPGLEAEISREAHRRPLGKVPSTLESGLLHEVNHAVQDLLGMQFGTSPDDMLRAYKGDLAKRLRLGLVPDEEKALSELRELPSYWEQLPDGPLKLGLLQRYLDTAGEENARLAQKLMGLTDPQLAAGVSRYPLESFYNKPPEQQIVGPGFIGLMRSISSQPPRVVYHGTQSDFPKVDRPTFVAVDPAAASAYAEKGLGAGSNVRKLLLGGRVLEDETKSAEIIKRFLGGEDEILQEGADIQRLVRAMQKLKLDALKYYDQDAQTGDVIDAYFVSNPAALKNFFAQKTPTLPAAPRPPKAR